MATTPSHTLPHSVVLVVTFLCLFAFCNASPSAGCGSSSPYKLGASSADNLTTVDGLRTFNVYMPEGYDPSRATPLVFHLHGGQGTGRSAEIAHGMDPTADEYNFIIVYPDGLDNVWNAGRCCGTAVLNKIDDVGFISAIIDKLEASLCIETKQIFSTGLSNGALMSHRLGCELSDRIKGIAPVEGGLELRTPACSPANPVAVFEVHGTADQNIPFFGGFGCGPTIYTNFTSIPVTLQKWIDFNQCSCPYASQGTCGSTYLIEGNGTCTRFGDCAKGAPTVLCVIQGGGHTWPDTWSGPKTQQGCDTTMGQFNTNKNIWLFFASLINDTTSSSSSSGSSASSSERVQPFDSYSFFLFIWDTLQSSLF